MGYYKKLAANSQASQLDDWKLDTGGPNESPPSAQKTGKRGGKKRNSESEHPVAVVSLRLCGGCGQHAVLPSLGWIQDIKIILTVCQSCGRETFSEYGMRSRILEALEDPIP